jgi:hypothetical protein
MSASRCSLVQMTVRHVSLQRQRKVPVWAYASLSAQKMIEGQLAGCEKEGLAAMLTGIQGALG